MTDAHSERKNPDWSGVACHGRCNAFYGRIFGQQEQQRKREGRVKRGRRECQMTSRTIFQGAQDGDFTAHQFLAVFANASKAEWSRAPFRSIGSSA